MMTANFYEMTRINILFLKIMVNLILYFLDSEYINMALQ